RRPSNPVRCLRPSAPALSGMKHHEYDPESHPTYLADRRYSDSGRTEVAELHRRDLSDRDRAVRIVRSRKPSFEMTRGKPVPSGTRRVILLALGPVSLLADCATLLPGSDFPKTVSTALTRPDRTQLGSDLAAAKSGHPGMSGFRLLAYRGSDPLLHFSEYPDDGTRLGTVCTACEGDCVRSQAGVHRFDESRSALVAPQCRDRHHHRKS